MASFPDNESRKLIEHYGPRIKDSSERLEFVLRSSRVLLRKTVPGRRNVFGSWGRRLTALDALCRASLLSRETLDPGFVDWASLLALRLWRVPAAGWKIALVSACALVMFMQAAGIDYGKTPGASSVAEAAETPAAAESREPPSAEPEERLDVWLVETQGQRELYSNGLRISNRWLKHTGPRSYSVFARGPGTETRQIDRRERPIGLVFHTTESVLPTLERTNNQLIRYEGRKLLNYISQKQLYHFVIDRFGQVYRIVPETEYAYHAGYSLWADGGELYINLNQSFIGISFESRPASVAPNVPLEEGVTEAQFAASRLLTEMLRERFGIFASNCVTHEMVSVNPNKMLIGYHTDWRGRFPFEQVGLPDNYQAVLSSVADWGFSYDSLFVDALGGEVWPGVRRSQSLFRKEATLRKLSVKQYRRQQARRFLALIREVKATTPELTWADHGVRRSSKGVSLASAKRADKQPD
jgi:hypothetical protein